MPPQRANMPNAIDWTSLFEGDILRLSDRYHPIIHQIALETWAAQHPNEAMPETSDDEIQALREGAYPSWWPAAFPRLQVRIRITHLGVNHVFGPTYFEARRAGAGWNAFQNIVKLLMTSAPNPFQGPVQIEILLPNGTARGGYNGLVRVGTGSASAQGLSEETDLEAWMPNEMKYLRQERKTRDEGMMRMFEGSVGIINAAASVISATKGTSDESEDGDWKTMLVEIVAGVGAKMMGQKEDEDDKKKDQTPKIPEKKPLQIADGSYPSEIDPAGPPDASDGWGEDPVDLSSVPEPESEEDAQVIEEEEEGQDEASAAPENPLDGKSADEVGRYVEEWIKNNKDKKKEIKKMGIKLAQSVL